MDGSENVRDTAWTAVKMFETLHGRGTAYPTWGEPVPFLHLMYFHVFALWTGGRYYL